MNGFIDRASQDPYVRYVELNGIFRMDDMDDSFPTAIINATGPPGL